MLTSTDINQHHLHVLTPTNSYKYMLTTEDQHLQNGSTSKMKEIAKLKGLLLRAHVSNSFYGTVCLKNFRFFFLISQNFWIQMWFYVSILKAPASCQTSDIALLRPWDKKLERIFNKRCDAYFLRSICKYCKWAYTYLLYCLKSEFCNEDKIFWRIFSSLPEALFSQNKTQWIFFLPPEYF